MEVADAQAATVVDLGDARVGDEALSRECAVLAAIERQQRSADSASVGARRLVAIQAGVLCRKTVSGRLHITRCATIGPQHLHYSISSTRTRELDGQHNHQQQRNHQK